MTSSSFGPKVAPYLYAGILAIVALAVSAFTVRQSIGEKQVAGACLAMISTFLGALFAFRLNEKKDAIKIEKEQKQALNRALFVIARQVNAIRSIQKDLESFKDDFERGFNCPAFRHPVYADLKLNFEELDFLLDSSPSILMRLSIEQEGFHQALEGIRTRNDFYVNEVQPQISVHGLNRREVTLSELKATLGDRLTVGSINSARVMYSLVEESAKSLPTVHGDLFESAKLIFPNAKFIKLASETGTQPVA